MYIVVFSFLIFGLKDSFSLILMIFPRIFINVCIGCKQPRDHFRDVFFCVMKNCADYIAPGLGLTLGFPQ